VVNNTQGQSGSCVIKDSEVTLNFVSANNLNNAKFVWGTLVSMLRKLNLMTLHTACGEIRQTELKDNKLTVYVKEEYLYNILIKEDNFKKLADILKNIKSDILLNFVLVPKQEDKAKINLEKLRKMFGDELVIK